MTQLIPLLQDILYSPGSGPLDPSGDPYGFDPAMLVLDGTSVFYWAQNVSVTGNKVTGVVRFKRSAFTADAVETLLRVYDPVNGNDRLNISVVGTGYTANPNHADTVRVITKNSSNVNICRLFSATNHCDNKPHVLFYSFDGDTGVATFAIDAVDADDTGNADRVAPTTGTLDTTDMDLIFGALNPTTWLFNGQAGFVGYHDVYLTNYLDFQDSRTPPKEIDIVTWTEWGSQPLFWSYFGNLANNKGSAPNAVGVGLGGFNDSKGAEPVINPLQQAIGFESGGMLLLATLPLGFANSSIDPRDYILFQHPDWTGMTAITGWNMNVNGQAYAPGSWNTFIGRNNDNDPQKQTNRRYYEMQGAVGSGVPPTNTGCRLLLNNSGASYWSTDYWDVRFIYSGSALKMELVEVVASSGFTRHSFLLTSAVDEPAEWSLHVEDEGDVLKIYAQARETDTNDWDAYRALHFTASRAGQNDTGFAFADFNSGTPDFLIRSVLVMDK